MSKSIFETKWIKEMKSKLMFLHKDWDEETVEKELENILWENLKDVPCEVINTYKCRKVDSTLLNMMQFIHDMKPIIGGFGVLYKNQNDHIVTPVITCHASSISDVLLMFCSLL